MIPLPPTDDPAQELLMAVVVVLLAWFWFTISYTILSTYHYV